MTTLFQTIKNTALFNVLLVVQLKFATFYSGILKALYITCICFRFLIHSSFSNSSIKEPSITVGPGEEYLFGVHFNAGELCS